MVHRELGDCFFIVDFLRMLFLGTAPDDGSPENDSIRLREGWASDPTTCDAFPVGPGCSVWGTKEESIWTNWNAGFNR